MVRRLTVQLPVATAGTYRLWGVFTQAPDCGTFRVAVNGRVVRDSLDLYGMRVILGPPTELGVHFLTAGTHQLTFEAVGSNPTVSPDAYRLGLDYVMLEAVSP